MFWRYQFHSPEGPADFTIGSIVAAHRSGSLQLPSANRGVLPANELYFLP